MIHGQIQPDQLSQCLVFLGINMQMYSLSSKVREGLLLTLSISFSLFAYTQTLDTQLQLVIVMAATVFE